jgi:hypothetical protein
VPPKDEAVTIGIGVIAEAGKWVIIGSDMRASWPNVSHNDLAGKQWDFPAPFDCCMCVAGRLSVAQMLVSELTLRLEKLQRFSRSTSRTRSMIRDTEYLLSMLTGNFGEAIASH